MDLKFAIMWHSDMGWGIPEGKELVLLDTLEEAEELLKDAGEEALIVRQTPDGSFRVIED